MLRRLLPTLFGHWLSLLGTAVTTISGNVILIFAVVDIVRGIGNPYASAVAYLAMPLFFIGGLLLIALGAWRTYRRGEYAASTGIGKVLVAIAGDRRAKRRLVFIVVGTVINVTLVSLAAYKGVTYTNSSAFCGKLCHSVMEPEYVAYQRSPHARVPCADCHIGEGASWFARSKLSGLRQVWATAVGEYSRPIPTPVHNLRPARETCEKCHWPQKSHGERLLVRHVYTSDEKNTRQTNVVRLHVGGVNRRTGRYEGIHWHVSPDVKVIYEALDARRARIGKVTVIEGKQRRVFQPPKKKGAAARVLERRVMDCVDCHNRPSHVFDPSPAAAVDRALAYGKLDRSLPWLRREALALLENTDLEPDRAAESYTSALQRFYRQRAPQVPRDKARAIAKAGRELGWIYRRNIYPRLRIKWNTYPNHLGHRTTDEGCYRCHDDEHRTREGEVISQDCDTCHEVLVEEEEKPDLPESLLRLGRM